jgi:hypothetical protein
MLLAFNRSDKMDLCGFLHFAENAIAGHPWVFMALAVMVNAAVAAALSFSWSKS